MLLSLNTCGAIGSVALGRVYPVQNRAEILGKALMTHRSYSAELIPRIASLLDEQHATIRDLQAIVVVRGPGSFTGIRVGLSTAKGLAEAASIPIIAVSRLALLAAVSGIPHVLAAIDAGRGDYYMGEYRDGESLGERLLSGEEARALAEHPRSGVLVYEESAEVSAGTPGDGVLDQCNPVYLQGASASDAMRFALQRFRDKDFEDVDTLDGNYLRRPNAELFASAGTGAGKP